MRPTAAAGAAALLVGFGAAPALACAPGLADARTVESRGYVLAFRPVPAQIRTGSHFAVEVAACAKDGAAAPVLARVDATMPAHRHGMNYRPSLTRQADGRWRAEGLMFHMPGRWELVFELTRAGATERVTADYQLE